jgi:hypothetical protein
MNISDAVDLLINFGIEARIIASGIVGTNPEATFGIYQEDSVWILNVSGVGQLATIVKLSEEVQIVTEAACNFYKLKSQCSDDSISLIYAIWELQKSGLSAQIDSDTDIHIRSTTIFDMGNVYDFMLRTVDMPQLENPCDITLRWLAEKRAWVILGHLPNRELIENYPENLVKAIEIIKKLPGD